MADKDVSAPATGKCGTCEHPKFDHPFDEGVGRGCLARIHTTRMEWHVCECKAFTPAPAPDHHTVKILLVEGQEPKLEEGVPHEWDRIAAIDVQCYYNLPPEKIDDLRTIIRGAYLASDEAGRAERLREHVEMARLHLEGSNWRCQRCGADPGMEETDLADSIRAALAEPQGSGGSR